MEIILVLIPVTLVIVGLALAAFSGRSTTANTKTWSGAAASPFLRRTQNQ